MRTLEQDRALFAWEQIDKVRNQKKYSPAKVAMHLRRLPAMVLTNGLGQTLAFLLADSENKKDKPSYVVYDMLAEWLITKRHLYEGKKEELLYYLVKGDRTKYQQAQEEVWALLNWLKKCADAYLPSTDAREGSSQ
ncbi:MAG: type III-B CRISPR module-associated protein Cmr5 [Firmicutes bacterium]|jgi:CRISPR-associated protein Cmr5|nr:type III-B CRISPR module-associated protein Cmr5 [Bacillota bacterium]